MRFPLPFLAFATVVALGAAGCGSDRSTASGPDETPPPDETPVASEAERAIVEADIVQVAGGNLYAMSRSGSVSIVDVSVPGRLSLLGRLRLAGEPFEMYRRGDFLVAMTNGAFAADGTAAPIRETNGYVQRPPGAGAGVVMIDVHNPAAPRVTDVFPVSGEIADSRVVGDVLYLATYEDARCFRCAGSPRTLLTSFDLTTPGELPMVDQLGFKSGPAPSSNSFTALPWKRSIVATPERIYIGGLADAEIPAYSGYRGSSSLEGVLEVVDVRDRGGLLVRGATIPIAGPVLSRWQIDERDGVLRVVSQRGAGTTRNGTGQPAIETFTIESRDVFTPLGYGTIMLPEQEGLRAVRFDADRAYAITYKNTDPLFVLDLRDPKEPRQRGEIHMPGFVFHMEPYGNKVLGLGVDRTDHDGGLNVSLFDVTDLDRPFLEQRVSFGPRYGSDAALQGGAIPEDQDRIQKAFRVIGADSGDALVVVPFSQSSGDYSRDDACASVAGGVQLVEWRRGASDTLTRRALLPLRGHARRALVNGTELVTVSESNVRTFSLRTRDDAVMTADLEIDKCTRNPYDNYGRCTFAPARASSRAPWLTGLLVVALLRRRSRRRTSRTSPRSAR